MVRRYNYKWIVLIILFIISIWIIWHYNFSYKGKTTPGSFGTYLDINSASEGYTFSKCIIETIDFSTQEESIFYFACNIDQDNPKFPINFLVTFPFEIEKYGSVCRKNIEINTSSGKTFFGEPECINIQSGISNNYILEGSFKNINELNFIYQFQLRGKDIFYRVSPDRLRFKMALTDNDLPITVNHCLKMGFNAGCASLILPKNFVLKINIPIDEYEIDFANSNPTPSIIDTGKGEYEISWNFNNTKFVQFDLVDKKAESIKNIATFLGYTLFGIILGILIEFWLNKKSKRPHQERNNSVTLQSFPVALVL